MFVYNSVYMKKRINIMLSEEAIQTADQSGNRSQYIEDLILGNSQRPLEVVPLKQLKELLEDKLKISVSPTANDPYDPFEQFLKDYSDPSQKKPPHPEYGYPCCHNEPKCKHWQFDQNQFKWINQLTGKEEDAPDF